MKLSKNSISSKLYRWFYCANELPVSLCPYFWQLVIAWVFLIPVAVFRIPALAIEVEGEDRNMSHELLKGLIIYTLLFLIFILFTPFSLFFTTFEKDTFFFNISCMGLLMWFVIVSYIIYTLVGKLVDYVRDRRKIKNREIKEKSSEKKPSIVTEFVKAKYNKYCPKIEWVDSDDNTK